MSHRFGGNNLTFVPASQLPIIQDWRELAQTLPAGAALFIVPTSETPLKRSMRRVADSLRAHGRHIAAVPCR